MITKDTHKVDWNKTAQVTGVVLLTLAKATWWLTKRTGVVLFALLTVLSKVFVAIVTVWASMPDNSNTSQDRHDPTRIIDPDNPGHDIMGRPINIFRDY